MQPWSSHTYRIFHTKKKSSRGFVIYNFWRQICISGFLTSSKTHQQKNPTSLPMKKIRQDTKMFLPFIFFSVGEKVVGSIVQKSFKKAATFRRSREIIISMWRPQHLFRQHSTIIDHDRCVNPFFKDDPLRFLRLLFFS